MPSTSPRLSLFLTPERAADLERRARERDIPVSTVIRCATMFAAANPKLPFNKAAPGRTVRIWAHVDAAMRDAVRDVAHQERVPASRWLAAAVEGFLAEVEREERGLAPSAELLRTREAFTTGMAKASAARSASMR